MVSHLVGHAGHLPLLVDAVTDQQGCTDACVQGAQYLLALPDLPICLSMHSHADWQGHARAKIKVARRVSLIPFMFMSWLQV